MLPFLLVINKNQAKQMFASASKKIEEASDKEINLIFEEVVTSGMEEVLLEAWDDVLETKGLTELVKRIPEIIFQGLEAAPDGVELKRIALLALLKSFSK